MSLPKPEHDNYVPAIIAVVVLGLFGGIGLANTTRTETFSFGDPSHLEFVYSDNINWHDYAYATEWELTTTAMTNGRRPSHLNCFVGNGTKYIKLPGGINYGIDPTPGNKHGTEELNWQKIRVVGRECEGFVNILPPAAQAEHDARIDRIVHGDCRNAECTEPQAAHSPP